MNRFVPFLLAVALMPACATPAPPLTEVTSLHLGGGARWGHLGVDSVINDGRANAVAEFDPKRLKSTGTMIVDVNTDATLLRTASRAAETFHGQSKDAKLGLQGTLDVRGLGSRAERPLLDRRRTCSR